MRLQKLEEESAAQKEAIEQQIREMTEEEHMLGKAIFGIIAMVLVGLFVAFTMLGEKEIPINYIDDVVNESTKKIV